MIQMNLSLTHGHREQTCSWQGGGYWGLIDWEVGVSRCKLFYGMDNQQGPIV